MNWVRFLRDEVWKSTNNTLGCVILRPSRAAASDFKGEFTQTRAPYFATFCRV